MNNDRDSGWVSRAIRLLKTQPVILALVFFFVVFSILYPGEYLSTLNFRTILRQFVTLMLFALGPSIVVVTGSLDLMYVGIWMLGGVLVWLAEPFLGIYAILAIPLLGVVTGFVVGVIQAKAKIPSFILTLSLLVTYTGLTSWLAGGSPKSVAGYEFITASLVPLVPTAFFWTLPLIVAAVYLMKYTRFGTYLYAIGSNEIGAELAGIDVEKFRVLAFTVSGLFTGLGAIILFQHLGGSSPVELTLDNVVWPLVAIVLGGTPLIGGSGGPGRTVLGALTFSVFYRGLYISPLHPYSIKLLVGILLLVSIVVSSRGLRGMTVT